MMIVLTLCDSEATALYGHTVVGTHTQNTTVVNHVVTKLGVFFFAYVYSS